LLVRKTFHQLLPTPPHKGEGSAEAILSARIGAHVTLEARADGQIAAGFDGHSVDLGKLSARAADRVQGLRTGLAIDSFAFGQRQTDKEIGRLVARLARHGLLEYRLGTSRGEDLVIIEPQLPGYWPQLPQLGDADVLVLSRFAYMHRRGNDMVLESPRAAALFRICNPKIASTVAFLSVPQKIKQLRQRDSLPSMELLALLVDCRILFKIDPARDVGLRAAEGDDDFILWDFHDLLFHARSTQGRHANPTGAAYPYAEVVPPPPAVRHRWPGKKIDLRKLSVAHPERSSPLARLLHRRHSTRSFDEQRPITLPELARFLDSTARVQSRSRSKIPLGSGAEPMFVYAARPYPSGGGCYALELYLTVDKCEGLARGFYHYDAGGHALVPIAVRAHELEAALSGAEFAMGAPGAPQILITIAARFGRVSWKYSALAYALILKDVGVLMQTFYLMATEMSLGGCAIGSADIDLFARMTGIEFHVEGPVGQFALGRAHLLSSVE
jgi:SagB-type dehydrogenase family enzyme